MTLSLPLASLSRGDWISLGYLVAIVCFILALRFLSDPARARNGNLIGAFGMAVAILATFFQPGLKNIAAIVIVMAITAPIGAYAARAVKMTAMPQMVALFNGVGGGAAALIAFADFHQSAPPPDRLSLNGSVGDRALGDDRLDLLHGQHGRVRQAAGADRRPADPVPGAEVREPGPPRRPARARDRDRRRLRAPVGARPADHRPLARLRRPLRAADRRRGHAGRDLAPERLHRRRRVG